jgi:hypothetical protein
LILHSSALLETFCHSNSFLYGTRTRRTLANEFSAEVGDAINAFASASDAACANDKATRHRSEGYKFKLFGKLAELSTGIQKR